MQEIRRFAGQVGGHKFDEGKRGMMAMHGRILKPLEDERGARELSFYETQAPRWFLPKCFGTLPVQGLPHLVLEDVREGMEYPCVMDLKIGRQCYVRDASQEKIDSEMKKYALQATVGFRAAGLRLEGKRELELRKEWGRSITEESVSELFETFFSNGDLTKLSDAESILAQLNRLKEDLSDDFQWSLFAASVLFIRDDSNRNSPKIVLVDFSYAYKCAANAEDDNLMFGLLQLISRLEKWLKSQQIALKTSLLFFRRESDSQILLARKKRGLGQGRWNGVGGKQETPERIEQTAIRECDEECGVKIESEEKLRKCGIIEFRFVDQPTWNNECHVYTVLWSEEMSLPKESDEMEMAKWFPESALPYDDMWADDMIWMPRVLAGEPFIHYRFWMRENEIERMEILV